MQHDHDIHEPGRRDWLAALLLRQPDRFMPRLAAALTRWQGVRRGLRRRLQSRLAAGAVGAALMLAMAGSPLLVPQTHAAATITVDGTCTLVDAIIAANTNAAVNNCSAGDSGLDTIDLQTDVTLTASYGYYYYSDTGLPLVAEDLIIEGNGHTIARDGAAPDFRVLAVADDRTVTINDTTISGGNSKVAGGGIYAGDNVTLALNNTVVSGNRAGLAIDGNLGYVFPHEGDGGGIFQTGGTLTIIDSEISGNTADSPDCFYDYYNSTVVCNFGYGQGGGIYQGDGDLSITNSTVSGNTAGQEGGGLYFSDYSNDGDTAVITGSAFEDNHSGNEGGGIYTRHSDLTLSNSTVSGNTADNEGGGLYFGSSYTNSGYPDYNDLPSTDYALITDSRFENNESFYNEGGAIYHDGGTMRIERSVISGNTADDEGGGIYAELGPLFLIDSTVSDNTSGNQGGGIYTDGPLSLSGTTVSGNTATTGNGGGIHVDDEGSVEIVNSTLSGNTAATGNGGGIHFNEVFSNNIYGVLSNTITHTTITDNTAGGVGGGVALDNNYDPSHSPAAVLVATIVSGNTATGAGDEIDDAPGTVTADAFNVLGDSGKSSADAFNNFTPGASDITATSDGTTPTAIGGILNTTLADNGGPTLTHLLVDGSPALDTAPNGPATDQRGAARPRGAAYDSGAVEGTTPLVDAVFMSTTLPGTTGDGLPFGMEDIIKWDGSAWSMWFDGSAAGLAPTGKWKHNINAFWIPDASADDVLISFTQNRRYVPGIAAPVNGMDLVWWDGSAFSLYFDGEDVGLNQMTQEKIDGLHVLPGSASPIGGSCLNYLLISTQGPGRITDYTGTSIRFGGEDVLGFCLTNAGDNTAGFWHMVLDGSAEGMPRNATDSISVSADGQTMYLTTQKTFNVDSASGGHSMVYAYDFNTGTFSGPYFSAPANGLPEKVDGLQVEGELGN